MGDVVNLNQFRKRQARDLKKRRSAENRVRAGRSKADREADKTEASQHEADFESKRLEQESDDPHGQGLRRPDAE
jgi:hypothetical protein